MIGSLAFAGVVVAIGALFLVYNIARPLLWAMVPMFLYSGIVLGAWDGVLGDFDATRVAAIKHRFANAYALEHMSSRARVNSCKDDRIKLTDDAVVVCARILNI